MRRESSLTSNVETLWELVDLNFSLSSTRHHLLSWLLGAAQSSHFCMHIPILFHCLLWGDVLCDSFCVNRILGHCPREDASYILFLTWHCKHAFLWHLHPPIPLYTGMHSNLSSVFVTLSRGEWYRLTSGHCFACLFLLYFCGWIGNCPEV